MEPLSPSLKAWLEHRWMPEPNSGCWLWLSAVDSDGYGKTRLWGHQPKAHRIAWLAYRGPIEDGLRVLHHCDVPSCVNPAHLFLGTQLDNMRDKVSKGRHLRGVRSTSAKLSETQARRVLFGGEKRRALAKELGVSESTIGMIRAGINWAHLRDDAP